MSDQTTAAAEVVQMDGREQKKEKKKVLEVLSLCTVVIILGLDSKYRSFSLCLSLREPL